MKSYGYNVTNVYNPSIIYQGIRNMKSDMYEDETRMLKTMLDRKPMEVYEYIINEMRTYQRHEHRIVHIKDGTTNKDRVIQLPYFIDLVIQHILMVVFVPIVMKSLYAHTYGSIPGRGVHKGSLTITKWIRDGAHQALVKYFRKSDIYHCFGSVKEEKLRPKLERIFRDDAFVDLLLNVSFDAVVSGLPLGSFTSPWLLNFMLTNFDHYVKEELQVDYFMRYMDDMVAFGPNKRKLEYNFCKMEEYLYENYELTLKPDDGVQRFSYKGAPTNDRERNCIKLREDCGTPLDFMGFKFYRTRTIIRESIFIRLLETVNRISDAEKNNKPLDMHDARALMSYLGWIYYADCHMFFVNVVNERVDINELKRKISLQDKGENVVLIQEYHNSKGEYWYDATHLFEKSCYGQAA